MDAQHEHLPCLVTVARMAAGDGCMARARQPQQLGSLARGRTQLSSAHVIFFGAAFYDPRLWGESVSTSSRGQVAGGAQVTSTSLCNVECGACSVRKEVSAQHQNVCFECFVIYFVGLAPLPPCQRRRAGRRFVLLGTCLHSQIANRAHGCEELRTGAPRARCSVCWGTRGDGVVPRQCCGHDSCRCGPGSLRLRQGLRG